MQPRPRAETSRPELPSVRFSTAPPCLNSELDEELDRLALVHRAVAVRHVLERAGAVEDAAGLDPPLEDVRQELLDVGAGRGGAAGDRDVVVEGREGRREPLVLR